MKLNKIYIKDWLALKPYENHSITDSYYLKICNSIKKMMCLDFAELLLIYLDEEENSNLFCCFMVSYFEDIISETHIFTTFVNKHQELNGKKLPFYDTSTYYENEINTQDIQFLIWYFFNTIQKDAFVNPNKEVFYKMAVVIMGILEEEYEYAPENKLLKTFYSLPGNETDFYKCRDIIDAILFRTYLFYTDTYKVLTEKEEVIINSAKDDKNVLSYLRENRDDELFNAHTKLLSLKGNEWVAEILGKKHPLYTSFLNISSKIKGHFFYKGQDENTVFLEHIASSKKFKLTKKSFDNGHTLTAIDTIVYMGMALWQEEWWFSGIFFLQDFNPNLVLDEKNSIKSRAAVNFLDHKDEEVNKTLEQQYNAFLDFNHQKQIAFLPANKVEEFANEYVEFYNTSLHLSEKKIKEVLERRKKDGFFGGIENETLDYNPDFESALVFLNPKSGLEIVFDVNSAFPFKENQYYNTATVKEHTLRVFMSEEISTELALFCMANFKKEGAFFKTNEGKFLMKNIDFLLRYFKGSQYHTVPQITYTGEKE